jgi:hypothetical protein
LSLEDGIGLLDELKIVFGCLLVHDFLLAYRKPNSSRILLKSQSLGIFSPGLKRISLFRGELITS